MSLPSQNPPDSILLSHLGNLVIRYILEISIYILIYGMAYFASIWTGITIYKGIFVLLYVQSTAVYLCVYYLHILGTSGDTISQQTEATKQSPILDVSHKHNSFPAGYCDCVS